MGLSGSGELRDDNEIVSPWRQRLVHRGAAGLARGEKLIYMSIEADIQKLIDDEVLFPYEQPRTRNLPRRRLLLTANAERHRTDPQSATNILCGRGYIEAALTRFVSGGRIFWAQNSRFLADLEPPPPEVWEIRVTEPKPQGRLFGRFVEADTLILTGFHTRNHLGAKGSQAWRDAMVDCVTQWDRFCPKLPVLTAATIQSYVTENCDDFPIKLSAHRKGSRRLRRRSIPGSGI